ncbi:universal stress protein [Rhizorhabdus histidinilytica]|jgi:nucleotide-binding universal stress UspA family protein|uniref:universal stress protein n=1 Tax=Rhizorhabdus histidinilytica TaxID=439228 RepID=UPI00322039C4
MAVKNILLLVHDDQGQEARFQAALDATRALDGHLTCVDVVIPSQTPAELWDGGAGSAMLLAEERQREAANRTTLEQRLAKEDVSWNWVDMVGEPGRCLRGAAAIADLIVVDCDPDGAAAGLVLESGPPVLAVPGRARGIALGGRALVAWDGSPEAEAALRAAVPLLLLAEQVMILQVDDGSIRIPAGEAASFLSRHGIHPLVILEKAKKGQAATNIIAAIVGHRADYLVMGGFGRSRLVEALFGGVSRNLLLKSPVPLFMAH